MRCHAVRRDAAKVEATHGKEGDQQKGHGDPSKNTIGRLANPVQNCVHGCVVLDKTVAPRVQLVTGAWVVLGGSR